MKYLNPLTILSRNRVGATGIPEPTLVTDHEPPATASLELDIPDLFRELERHYEKGKARLNRYANSVAEGGFLRKGRADHLRALNGVLSTLLDSYTAGVYTKARADLQKLDAMLELERNRLDDYRHKLLFATPGKGSPSLFDKAQLRDHTLNSVFYIGEQIAQSEKQVELLGSSRGKVLSSFCLEMREVYDWRIDERQATVLLYQANGESIVQAAEVVRIVTKMEAMLAEIRKQTSNPENLRKYYGMAVMTRLMVLLMYDAHISDYYQKWFPALEKREVANSGLMAETTELMQNKMPKAASDQLKRNWSIQKNTSAAIGKYKTVLLQRLNRTKEARDAVSMEAELALNTFKTLDDAIGFANDVAAFNYDQDALTALLPSDLVPLHDDDLSPLYMEISQELMKK